MTETETHPTTLLVEEAMRLAHANALRLIRERVEDDDLGVLTSRPSRRPSASAGWAPPCPLTFKSAECGYTGPADSCDKGPTWCRALGNFVRFQGYPVLPGAPPVRMHPHKYAGPKLGSPLLGELVERFDNQVLGDGDPLRAVLELARHTTESSDECSGTLLTSSQWAAVQAHLEDHFADEKEDPEAVEVEVHVPTKWADQLEDGELLVVYKGGLRFAPLAHLGDTGKKDDHGRAIYTSRIVR